VAEHSTQALTKRWKHLFHEVQKGKEKGSHIRAYKKCYAFMGEVGDIVDEVGKIYKKSGNSSA